MSSVSDSLLTGIISYGAPLFGLILFLGALGVPVPGTLMVVAAGAFVRQGAMDLTSSVIIGFLCAILGDSLSFAMGRFGGYRAKQRFGASGLWSQAQTSFDRRGPLAVYLSRFLITAVAIPVNWIAGGSGLHYSRFIMYDATGEVTWLLLYGGLGYIFGSQWEVISQFLSDFSGFALGLTVLGAGIYFWVRQHKKHRRSALVDA